MKVQVDPARCAAYGACADTCPSVFELDDSGFARVVGDGTVPPELVPMARVAVANCPEKAISAQE